ncbi:MAG: hypothetical protein ABIJ96_00685 [Elusimicrobiota bacterium]
MVMDADGGRKLVVLTAALLLLPSVHLSAAAPRPVAAETLRQAGYSIDYNGDLVDLEVAHRRIRRDALSAANFQYSDDGVLMDVTDGRAAAARDEHVSLMPPWELERRLAEIPGEVAWAPDRFQLSPQLSAFLRADGFTHDDRGNIYHRESGALMMRDRLQSAQLDYTAGGELAYRAKRESRKAGSVLDNGEISHALQRLMDRGRIAQLDAGKLGGMLGGRDALAAGAVAAGGGTAGGRREDRKAKIAELNMIEQGYRRPQMRLPQVPEPPPEPAVKKEDDRLARTRLALHTWFSNLLFGD